KSMSPNAILHQKMLNKVLNVQLAVSSLFFFGCIIFTINLTFEAASPDMAFISVPGSNSDYVAHGQHIVTIRRVHEYSSMSPLQLIRDVLGCALVWCSLWPSKRDQQPTNVLTPITTLYFIKPYRRFILSSLRRGFENRPDYCSEHSYELRANQATTP
ncbi:hypothetical protein PENTCL1PPCAC_14033, partial [Pristionchus entomophagus]